MNNANGNKKTPSRPAQALIFLALVGAGLAGNYLKYELFFNIQFIFGSVFALLALQMLGFRTAILAAALISGMTYLLWNHPYAIIIMTAEVIAVGWLTRRKGMGMVPACAFYWLCLGMPLVYLFYHHTMHLPVDTTLITMVKQALNGVANALAARIIFMAGSSIFKKTLYPFREIIFHLLTLFVLVPSLTVLCQESRREFADTDQAIQESLLHASTRTVFNLEQWLQLHQSLLSHLAEMAATLPVASMQHSIENVMILNSAFLRLGIMDKDAISIAYTPLTDELGRSNLGRDFSDRPYLPALKQGRKPMLSEVMMGRVGIPSPIVGMMAPILSQGEFAGYAGGVIDLQDIQQIMGQEVEDQGIYFILQDKKGRVITSNRPNLKIMEPFTREAGDLRRLDGDIIQWVPFSQKNISVSERWKRSTYIREISLGALSEWKLVLEQPVAPFQKKLYNRYATKLGVLLLVLAIALTLAELISRRIMNSLERLNALSTDLPQKLLSKGELVWPQSSVLETENLLANFRDMAGALSEKFNEISLLNASLEDQVREKTQAALQLATRYQTIMMTATDGIHVVDLQGNVVEANDAFCRMLGYSREEMLRLNVKDWEARLTPDEILQEIQRLIKSPGVFTSRDRRSDGTLIEVEINAGGVLIEGQPYLFKATRDITERKRAEKEREQFFTFFQTSTDMMCIADPNGAFLQTNPACTELLGYSADELVAKPFIDFILPDDKQSTQDEMARQMQCGYSLNFENRYLCKDGSFRWLSWRANYNKEEGLTYATARDITERKRLDGELREAKDLFEHLFGTSPDAALISRIEDGTITHINDVFIQLFGYSREELIGNKTLNLKLWTPDDRQRFVDALRSKGFCRNMEFQFHRKDGSTFYGSLSANLTPIEGVPHIVSNTRDISDLKQAEELLLRSVKEKEVMLKEIHHRVKNNMQVVYSLLNLQAKGISDSAVRAMFEESKNRVSSMALIHEKLYRSTDLASIEFKEYLQSLMIGIKETYKRHDIALVVDMEPLELDINVGIPCGLIANELVSNCLKHAFPPGRQGTVRIGITKSPDGSNVLTVHDNGLGFPAGIDFRNTTSLGLQLVTVLTGQLKGTIELTQDEGTEFRVTFPSA